MRFRRFRCGTGLATARLIKSLIAARAEPKNDDESTQLHYSALKGHLEIVKSLITDGADVNAKDEHGSTPLHYSCKEGHQDVTIALITAGADVNAKEEDGSTPLHYAAYYDSLEGAITLIAAGADVNAKEETGSTPLHHSAKNGNASIVKAIITAGADVSLKDKEGRTPLDMTNIYQDEKTIKTLIKYTILNMHIFDKPKFVLDDEKLNDFWNECEEQVKELKVTFLGNSFVSFFTFLMETNDNKLALYSYEENFGLSDAAVRVLYIKMFPTYFEDIEAQFVKGNERAYLLHKCQELMKNHIFKTLPIEVILKISEYLKNEELKSLLFSFK